MASGKQRISQVAFGGVDMNDTSFFDIALNLLHGGSSITEVAEKVGFLSVSAFSNSFKKKFGFPPTKIN